MNKQTPVKFFAIRKGRRLAVQKQADAAVAAGYDPDRFFDLDEEDITELIGLDGSPPMLRKGNVFGVYRYEFLVPVGKGKGDRSARALLKKITFRLLELGVVLEEIETGRSCKDENGVLKIYADAVDRLAGTRKHDSPGRPKEHEYSDDDLKLIQAIWANKDLTNPEQRAQAVRDAGFPKFKVSTWYTLRGQGRVK